MLSRSFLKDQIKRIQEQLDRVLVMVDDDPDEITVKALANIDHGLKALRYEVVNHQLMLAASIKPNGGHVDGFLDEHDNPCHCCHCVDRRRRRDGNYRRYAPTTLDG